MCSDYIAKLRIFNERFIYYYKNYNIFVDSNSSGAGASSSSSNNEFLLPTDQFTEADVSEIIKMGFSRDKVIFELRGANGSKTQAIAALIAKSLKF